MSTIKKNKNNNNLSKKGSSINEKNILKIINELRNANKKLDDCTFSNCGHIAPKKKVEKVVVECNQILTNYTGENRFEGIMKVAECIDKHKFGEILEKLHKCSTDNCKKNLDNIKKISNKLLILINPKYKIIVKNNSNLEQLFKKLDKCEKTNCEHIFPDEKKKEIQEKCKLEAKNNFKQMIACQDRENFTKMNKLRIKCKNTKCKKIGQSLSKNLKEIFSLNSIVKDTMEKAKEIKEKYKIGEPIVQ